MCGHTGEAARSDASSEGEGEATDSVFRIRLRHAGTPLSAQGETPGPGVRTERRRRRFGGKIDDVRVLPALLLSEKLPPRRLGGSGQPGAGFGQGAVQQRQVSVQFLHAPRVLCKLRRADAQLLAGHEPC